MEKEKLISTASVFLFGLTSNAANICCDSHNQRIVDYKNHNVELVNNNMNLYRSSETTAFSSFEINRMLNLKRLRTFSNLEFNWNGYNGLEIDENIIGFCRIELSKLNYQPRIFPTGRGTIQFEFKKNEDYLEIEVFEKSLHVLIEKNGSESEHDSELEKIESIVNEFFTH